MHAGAQSSNVLRVSRTCADQDAVEIEVGLHNGTEERKSEHIREEGRRSGTFEGVYQAKSDTSGRSCGAFQGCAAAGGGTDRDAEHEEDVDDRRVVPGHLREPHPAPAGAAQAHCGRHDLLADGAAQRERMIAEWSENCGGGEYWTLRVSQEKAGKISEITIGP